jgi:hypothetical protein
MSTPRSPRLPADVSLCDAGTNSRCHDRVPTPFLHAASANFRISPPAISRRTVMAVAFIPLIKTPHNISLFKSP